MEKEKKMKIIKAMLQKNVEYSQMKPNNAEALVGLVHAYCLVNVIQEKKVDEMKVSRILKACLKIDAGTRAMKIQPFTAKMMAQIDEFMGGLKVSGETFADEYASVDFTEGFDIFGTEIQDLE